MWWLQSASVKKNEPKWTKTVQLIVIKVRQSSATLLINWINTSRQSSVDPLITLINAHCSISLSLSFLSRSPSLCLCTYICEIINKLGYTHCHQLIIMQIQQQQSMVGLLICARSLVKLPNVLRDVHRAIRERSDLGWRGEESAALKDRNGCHLLTVKLIPRSLSRFAFMEKKLRSVPVLSSFVSLCVALHIWGNDVQTTFVQACWCVGVRGNKHNLVHALGSMNVHKEVHS